MESVLTVDISGRYYYNYNHHRALNPTQVWETYCSSFENNGPTISISENRLKNNKNKVIFSYVGEDSSISSIIHSIREEIKAISPELPNLNLWCAVSTDKKSTNQHRIYFPYHRFDLNQMHLISNMCVKYKLIILKEHIPIYGSDDYVITHTYDNVGENTLIKFMEPFCISNHADFFREGLEYEYETEEYILPVLLSMYYGTIYTPENMNDDINAKKDNYDLNSDNFFLDLLDTIPLKIIRRYNIWRDIGLILRNRYNYSDEGLQLWKTLTEKALEADSMKASYLDISSITINIELIYKSYASSPLTVSTLAWYSRQYNRIAYNRIITKVTQRLINNIDDADPLSIARLFHLRNWLTICHSNTKWYLYDENRHRWSATCGFTGITGIIIGPFIEYIDGLKRKYFKESDNCIDATEKVKLCNLASIMGSMSKYISSAIIGPIKTLVSSLFNNEKFCDLLEMNPHYTVTANCVIEAVNYKVSGHNAGKLIVRKGKPQDYKEYGSNIRYNVKIKNDDIAMKMFDKWMKELFPDYQVREYFLKYLASTFCGGNREKIIVAMIGGGNNGKTAILKLFTEMLGEDFFVAPSTLLGATKANQGAATPELTQAWRTKITAISELDNTRLDPQKTKAYSGNDPVWVRRLYSEGGNKPFWSKIILFANDMPPHIKAGPQAIDRIVIIPFVSRWSELAPDSYEEQQLTKMFKEDKEFESNLPMLAVAAIKRSIEYYSKYMNNMKKSELPQMINEANNGYWYSNDTYAQFIQHKLQMAYKVDEPKQQDSEKYVSIIDMYTAYCSYLDICKPSVCKPNMETTRVAFSKRMGEVYEDAWWGIEIKKGEIGKVVHTNEEGEQQHNLVKLNDYSSYKTGILTKNRRLMYEK